MNRFHIFPSLILLLVILTLNYGKLYAQGQVLASYTCNSSTYTYVVPPGVCRIKIKAWGAGGGCGGSDVYDGGNGGGGAYAERIINVSTNDILTIYVGCRGQNGGLGGWGYAKGGNGGKSGSYNYSGSGGGGGGASAVLLNGNLVLLAAGGGGGGGGGCNSAGGQGGAGGQNGANGGCGTGGLAGAHTTNDGQNGMDLGNGDGPGSGGGGGGYLYGGKAGTVSSPDTNGCGSSDCGAGGGGGGKSYAPGGIIMLGNNQLAGNATDPDRNGYGNGVLANSVGTSLNNGYVRLIDMSYSVNINVVANKNPICQGDTLQLSVMQPPPTVAPLATYQWVGPAGFNSTSSSPVINNINPNGSGSYLVMVKDANGCEGYDNIVIQVNPKPTVSSNVNKNSLCVGDTLQLISTSTSATTFNWSGPSGYASNKAQDSIIVTSTSYSGNYIVKVTDANGCSNSDTVQVTVNPLPVPDFSVNTACPNSATTFVNTSSIASGTIANYLWSFPGGTPSSANTPNPSTVYASGGSYTATLVAVSNAGCIDSITKNYNIPYTPVADFQSDTVCLGNATCFTDLSNVQNGTINQWSWNFGDGSPVNNSQNPCHTYTAAGSYNVSLMVFSNDNCTDQVNKTVIVLQPPAASFSVNNVCEDDQAAVFINNSSNATNYNWEFGDGTPQSNSNSPTHIYTNPGVYTVQLVAYNANCNDTAYQNITVYPKPTALFSATDVCLGQATQFTDMSNISSGNISQWSWSFNPGSSNNQNPQHTYTSAGSYIVTLIITSDNNCKDTATNTVAVWPLPNVDFTTNNVCLGDPSVFTSTTTISSGTVIGYSWNFGDNTTGNGNSVTHTYAGAGNYIVKLTAMSDKGCTDSAIKTIEVWPLPNVDFVSDTNSGCTPLCVNFTSLDSISSGSIVAYQWNLGNGQVGTSPKVETCYENQYSTPLNYNVSLKVTSDKGCDAVVSKANFIIVYPQPVADFYSNNEDQSIFQPIFEFYNQTVNANQYEWDFGDGTKSLLVNPQHEYKDTGTYTVRLYAENVYGCKDSIEKQVKVTPEFTLYIPNAFTPDLDSRNNTWKPYGMGVSKINIYVFNRWGELIWESDNMEDSWDGTFQGEPVPNGVYAYRILVESYNEVVYEYLGSITLIR